MVRRGQAERRDVVFYQGHASPAPSNDYPETYQLEYRETEEYEEELEEDTDEGDDGQWCSNCDEPFGCPPYPRHCSCGPGVDAVVTNYGPYSSLGGGIRVILGGVKVASPIVPEELPLRHDLVPDIDFVLEGKQTGQDAAEVYVRHCMKMRLREIPSLSVPCSDGGTKSFLSMLDLAVKTVEDSGALGADSWFRKGAKSVDLEMKQLMDMLVTYKEGYKGKLLGYEDHKTSIQRTNGMLVHVIKSMDPMVMVLLQAQKLQARFHRPETVQEVMVSFERCENRMSEVILRMGIEGQLFRAIVGCFDHVARTELYIMWFLVIAPLTKQCTWPPFIKAVEAVYGLKCPTYSFKPGGDALSMVESLTQWESSRCEAHLGVLQEMRLLRFTFAGFRYEIGSKMTGC